MDVQWMQNFLCLSHCHSLKTNAEGEDELRQIYTCPYCYHDLDIASLCSHIEDEHCYEPIFTACPVCAAKIVNDLVGHIMHHHGNLFKHMQRRRRSRKPEASSNIAFSFPGSEESPEKSFTPNVGLKPSVGSSESSKKDPEEEATRAMFVQDILFSMFITDT